MSSPQAFLLENNVFPTTEPNRVHYRFSYAEAPDSFVGPHYYYHDDHWIKTPIPEGTEPTDEQWWNIFPEAAIDTYVAISDGLRLLLGARCMVNTVPILGEQVDRTVDDSLEYWVQKAIIDESGRPWETAWEEVGEFQSAIMKAMGTPKDHWDDELGNVLTDYLLLIDDYMTGATGRPLPDSAGIDTLVRIMTERFDALDSYGPLNWNTDPALWQDANHVRTELEQFRLRIGPDDLERPGIYEDFYKFMRRCAGAYQSQVWGETKAWGLRSPMNDYIRVGQTYQGFEISMQGRFINSRNQEVAWYKTSGGQVVFLNYLITPDTDTTVVSWRQELGRLEPGDIVFSVLDDTPRPVIIENITDDVATINYGESVQYPLPLLEKLPDETPVGSEPPASYEPFIDLSARDPVTVTGYEDGAVTSFKGTIVGVVGGELENQYAVYLPHAETVDVYWVPRSLLEWVAAPPPPPPKSREREKPGVANYGTPALGAGVLLLFGMVWAID